MNFLGDFLEKFKNIRDPRLDKKIVAEIISSFLPITISEEKITIKNNLIFLNVSSVLKSEISIKKEDIIKSIQEKIPALQIVDIK